MFLIYHIKAKEATRKKRIPISRNTILQRINNGLHIESGQTLDGITDSRNYLFDVKKT